MMEQQNQFMSNFFGQGFNQSFGAMPSGFPHAPPGYHQPPPGFQQPPSSFQQPPSNYQQQPPSSYQQQPPSSYQQPPSSYQQRSNQQAAPGYQQPPQPNCCPPPSFSQPPHGYGPSPPFGQHPSATSGFYGQGQPPQCNPGLMDVDGVVTAIKKASFQSDRSTVVKMAAASQKPLKCSQLDCILKALPFNDEKESACLDLYPLLVDKENLAGVVLPALPRASHAKIIKAASSNVHHGQTAPHHQPCCLPPGQGTYPMALDTDTLVASLKRAGMKSDRAAQIQLAASSGKHLSCAQLAALLKALSFSDEKESAAITLFPLLTDRECLAQTVFPELSLTSRRNVLKALGLDSSQPAHAAPTYPQPLPSQVEMGLHPGYPGYPGYPPACFSDADIQGYVAALKRAGFCEERTSQARLMATSGKRLTSAQLGTMVRALNVLSEVETVCVTLFPCLLDPESFVSVALAAVSNPGTRRNVIKSLGLDSTTAAAPSPGGMPYPPAAYTHDEMNTIVASIKRASYSEERTAQVNLMARVGKRLSAAQLGTMVKALTHPAEAENACVLLFPCLLDTENFIGSTLSAVSMNTKRSVLNRLNLN